MSTEEPGKLKVRADPHRVMAWVDAVLARTPFQLALAAILVLIVALLLGPRLWEQDSILSRLKVNSRWVEGNLKATRDFEYWPTSEQFERERKAAVAKILPVFDHQADLGAIVTPRIRRAFRAMTGTDAGVPPRPLPTKAAKAEGRDTDLLADSKWERQRRQFSNILQVEVAPEDFEILRSSGFSAEARSSLQIMVGEAMNKLIVAHRGALAPYNERPILVRHLVNNQPRREEKISDLSRIKDLLEVKEELSIQAKNVHAVKLAPELAKAVVSLAQKLVVPNVSYNGGESKARRQAERQKIKRRTISIVKGQVIIRDGDPVTKEHVSMIRTMESLDTRVSAVQQIFGLALFVMLVLVVIFRYARHEFTRFYRRPRDLLAMSVLVIGLVGLAKGVVSVGGGVMRGQDLPVFIYVIPVAAGAMLVRLLITAEASALFAVILSALCGLLVDRNLAMALFYLVTSLVGAAGVTRVQSRSTILRSGLWAGLAGGALLLGMRLFQGEIAALGSIYAVFAAAAGGVLAAFMTLALLPAKEWLFAYTTDVTLLELANLNHPLLRDLILRAPGTYHHSMIVGSLSEAACEAINANGLLARVASYYHDIGKVKNAVYFAENFKPGDNPHNRLKPSMSALIIRSHVKDTIEMLREHGLPELVIETATQHHGKTLIEFFYHKASERVEKDETEEVHEEDYRYPGPKPQSREAGVLMLADGVEAAARSLAEATEDRLRAVVQRVINSKFTDGQLDHCDLTLRDLHLIAKSFLQVLRGIYHQRPTYPWQQQGRREDVTMKRERGDSTKMKTIERERDATSEEAPAKGKHEATGKQKKLRPDTTKDGKKGKPEGKEEKRAQPEGKGEKKGKTRDDLVAELKKGAKKEDKKAVADSDKDGDRQPQDQPAGEGTGEGDVESAGAKEAPEESSQDIKRLGLN